ncbi:unnamed protein product [Ectocarpus sp. 12 AP-2014]
MKSVGALQGLGSFVSRKVSGSRGSGRHQDGGVDSDFGDGGGGGGGGSRRRASSSSGGFGELPAGKMAELRRQREAAGAASNMMGGNFGSGSAHSVPSPADSWDSAGHWDEKKQYQIQLGEEAGDGIPAAIDGKARKILGLPPHRRASVGGSVSAGSSPAPGAHAGGAGRRGAGGAGRPGRAAGGAGMPPPPPPSRSGPLPKRTPVRPVQASPSPLRVQNQQHHFPGDGSAAAGRGPPPQPGTGGAAAAAAAGGAGGHDAVLSTPETGTSMAPFAEGGVHGVMSTSSSGSEDGDGDGSCGSRRRKRGGGDGGGKAFRSSKSSSSGGGSRHLPPRDGTSRAAARAARMEADKLAALRHFVSEAKLETMASRSGGGAATVDAAAEAATRGHGRARSGSGGAQLVVLNDTEDEDARAEMTRIDPPLLPSGELLPEDSKAWKVLGAGGGGNGKARRRQRERRRWRRRRQRPFFFGVQPAERAGDHFQVGGVRRGLRPQQARSTRRQQALPEPAAAAAPPADHGRVRADGGRAPAQPLARVLRHRRRHREQGGEAVGGVQQRRAHPARGHDAARRPAPQPGRADAPAAVPAGNLGPRQRRRRWQQLEQGTDHERRRRRRRRRTRRQTPAEKHSAFPGQRSRRPPVALGQHHRGGGGGGGGGGVSAELGRAEGILVVGALSRVDAEGGRKL